jgi:hypothetical protein
MIQFLGLHNPSIVNITEKFGSPILVEQSESKNTQFFTYQRDAYLLIVTCDKSGKVIDLNAIGLNKSVKYHNVKLLDSFASVIKNNGKPLFYKFKDSIIIIGYNNYSYFLSKINKKYQVVGIDVQTDSNNSQGLSSRAN